MIGEFTTTARLSTLALVGLFVTELRYLVSHGCTGQSPSITDPEYQDNNAEILPKPNIFIYFCRISLVWNGM